MSPLSMPVADFVRLIIDVCRMRRGPQDLPYSPVLLVLLLAASSAFEVLVASMLGDAVGDSFMRSLSQNVCLLGFAWCLLSLQHRRARFVQVAIALIACGLAIAVLQLPLTFLLAPGSSQMRDGVAHVPATALGFVVVIGSGLLVIWQTLVIANILRAALQIAFAAGIALSFAWLIAYRILASLLASVYG